MVWVEVGMVSKPRLCSLILGLLILIESAKPLKLLELRVPPHISLGDRARLACLWELEPSEVLYSVKWYKDGKEFFRHVPWYRQRTIKFPLLGLEVEDSDSSGSNLTLAPAVLATHGRYRCEVSGEKPYFRTVSDHADLIVVVLPKRSPVLSGFQPRYRTGDRVRVNCSSGWSAPPMKLAWYINGKPAPFSALSPAVYSKREGLHSASLLLEFEVTEEYVGNGLKAKCLSTINTIYWKTVEENAVIVRTVHAKPVFVHQSVNQSVNQSVRSDEMSSRADRVRSEAETLIKSSANIIFAVLLFYILAVF